MTYNTGQIIQSPYLCRAIVSSNKICEIVAKSIMRYRNFDFGNISPDAKKINLINSLCNKPTFGIYDIGNSFIYIITINHKTMCMFEEEWSLMNDIK